MKTIGPRQLAALSFALLSFSAVGAADAWESSARWTKNTVPYKVNPSNLDLSNDDALAAIQFGAQAWTDQSQAAFWFAFEGTSSSNTLDYNGENLVLFRNEYGSTNTARASTYTWKLGPVIVETDIVFWDKAVTFIRDGTPCVDEIIIENTAIHEFGHALGLDHSPVDTATMYKSGPACSTYRLDLDLDDIEGAESLYPCFGDAACGDGNACTTDSCQGGKCVRSPTGGCCAEDADCSSDDPCFTAACVDDACEYKPVAGCCASAADCDDGDDCTADTCVDDACVRTPVPGCCTDDLECADDDACTEDRCVDNACLNQDVGACSEPEPDGGTAGSSAEGGTGGSSAGDASGSQGGSPGSVTDDASSESGCTISTTTPRSGLTLFACLLPLFVWRLRRRSAGHTVS